MILCRLPGRKKVKHSRHSRSIDDSSLDYNAHIFIRKEEKKK